MTRSVNPIPNPDPNPTQAPQMSLKEAWPQYSVFSLDRCALIGKPVCGVCVGGGGRVFNYTYIYSQTGRPCEVAELVGVLVAETIHPACMCEGEDASIEY